MRQELRCASTLHGVMVGDRTIEVKCGRRACGAEPGVVVLHKINTVTGAVEETNRFSDPNKRRTRS